MNINLQEFDGMVEAFLDDQDDSDKDEYWATNKGIAELGMIALRDHLFGDVLIQKARYEQYLELKKEFEDEEN